MANTLKIKRGAAATIPQGELAEPLFTTDTYDLYIGKGSTNGNQRFQKYIASGTSSQFLKGDGSLDSTTYQATSEKGQNNGYASLDAGGKIPAAQLPSSVIEYKGTWNASTNTPTLSDGTGDAGDVYIVSVGGTQNLGSGNISFDAGDWVMYNGSVWQKSTGSNAVASVNGQTGIVVLDTDDISEPVSATNLWFTNARARTAISLTTSGSSGAATYDNSTGVLNVPQYTASGLGAVPTSRQLTINGTAYDLSADRTWSVGTVTSVAALTIGTTGTDIGSSVANGTTTPVITLNIPTASATNRGALSSADWTTFNNKQNALSGTINTIAYWDSATSIASLATATYPSLTELSYVKGVTSAIQTQLDGKQATLTNPVTGTGTNNYVPKFTTTGSTIGDSSLYYSQGANSNEYTFGSIGAGNIYNNSIFNILSNSNASIYLQFGSNKYVQFYNLYGDVGLSVANSGVHSTFNIIYFNGTGTGYTTLNSPGGEGLRVNPNSTLRFTQYSSNGFVKTSSSDGTITIDTNTYLTTSSAASTYLPLTGGTLTGALSGTSATFSGPNVTIGNATAATNVKLIFNGVLNKAAGIEFQQSGTPQWYIGNGIASEDNNFELYNSNGTMAMKIIKSTNAINFIGAATFSSSVTAASLIVDTTTLVVDATNDRVGIGTSSPSQALSIGDGTSTKYVRVQGSVADSYFGSDSGGTFLGNNSNAALYFQTNSAERMRITSGGDMLFATARTIGVNTSDGTDTSYLLISGGGAAAAGRGAGIVLNGNDRTTYGGQLDLYTGDSATSYMTFSTGGSERMRITNGGEVLINTTTDSGAYYLQVNGSVYATAYYESSDIRLKDVITNTYSDTFSAIEFMWKDKRDDKKHWGYAAQDVMRFIPDAIETNKDGMMTVNYNEAHTWKIAQLEKEILELKAKING